MPASSTAGEPLPPERQRAPTPAPRLGSPSVLDLVRLSPTPVFPPGGEGLYRQIALLTELRAGQAVLDAACGRGISTSFLASNYGVEGHGVDSDSALIEDAEQRARSTRLEEHLHFTCTSLDDLPYRDGIFDVSIGEVGLALSYDPASAIRELVRVTRPMGCVILVQLVWTGHVDEARREALVQHLGARPMLLVEWKQLLREAGVVDLHVEDWSDQSSPFRPSAGGAIQPAGGVFHDLRRIFTLRQKMAILRRAVQRWGWRGVRGALVREQEIHRLLSQQRVLGLSLIKGTKWSAGETDAQP